MSQRARPCSARSKPENCDVGKLFQCEGRGGSCCARGRAHSVRKAGTGKHSNAKAGAEVAAPGDGRTPYEKRGLESIRMGRQGRKLLRPGTGALRTKSQSWKAFRCEGTGGSCCARGRAHSVRKVKAGGRSE